METDLGLNQRITAGPCLLCDASPARREQHSTCSADAFRLGYGLPPPTGPGIFVLNNGCSRPNGVSDDGNGNSSTACLQAMHSAVSNGWYFLPFRTVRRHFTLIQAEFATNAGAFVWKCIHATSHAPIGRTAADAMKSTLPWTWACMLLQVKASDPRVIMIGSVPPRPDLQGCARCSGLELGNGIRAGTEWR